MPSQIRITGLIEIKQHRLHHNAWAWTGLADGDFTGSGGEYQTRCLPGDMKNLDKIGWIEDLVTDLLTVRINTRLQFKLKMKPEIPTIKRETPRIRW